MNRTQKQETVERLHQIFSDSTAVLLIDFSGINVAQAMELRRKVSQSGRYQGVKNSLALRAAEDTPLAALHEHFQGPTAIAFTNEDPVALAKALKTCLNDYPDMSFKAAVLEQEKLTAEQVTALADLPSHEELLTRLASLLQAPLVSFAQALQSPLRNLGSLLKQLAERKKD